MINDQPAPVSIPVDKAEPSRTTGWFAVAGTQKGIRPTVDDDVTLGSNALLTKNNLVLWRHRAEYVEVVTNGGGLSRSVGDWVPHNTASGS